MRATAVTMLANSSEGCVFCSADQSDIVHTHELAFVRRDGYPLTPGHSLVIPRRHVASFFELTPSERVAVLELLEQAKQALDNEYRPDGYNIGINDGAAAGQTVMHLHVHLVPRYRGDIADPRGGVRWILPDKAAYWNPE